MSFLFRVGFHVGFGCVVWCWPLSGVCCGVLVCGVVLVVVRVVSFLFGCMCDVAVWMYMVVRMCCLSWRIGELFSPFDLCSLLRRESSMYRYVAILYQRLCMCLLVCTCVFI